MAKQQAQPAQGGKVGSNWITFRPDNELHALIDAAAKRGGVSRSAIVRQLLREALVEGAEPAERDLWFETMRLTSHTIKRATSRMLKEVTERLPEILKEESVELAE